jgi:hypothetical protein
MTYAQTILASVIGGGVVGVFALLGVVYTSHRAAKAAKAADLRAAAAAEAADRRHADAEQARWTREQRVAAYVELLARVEAQVAQGIVVRVIFRSRNPATASNVDHMELFRHCSRDTLSAYRRLSMVASREVFLAASRLNLAVTDKATVDSKEPPATDAEVAAAGVDYEPAHEALRAAIRLELGVPE